MPRQVAGLIDVLGGSRHGPGGNLGWPDHLMIGGHIHQDDTRMHVHPVTGFVSHVCQVSSFKEFDLYADVNGFISRRIKPVWDLVIQPAKADSDPDKIKVFWTSEDAQKFLEAVR